jgi:hypothetical protein
MYFMKVAACILAIALVFLICSRGIEVEGGIGRNYADKLEPGASEEAENDWFGYSVAQYCDYVICGVPIRDNASKMNSGTVYIYQKIGDAYTRQSVGTVYSDLVENGMLGYSVSICGDFAFAGAPHYIGAGAEGAVFVLGRSGSSWAQTQKLAYPDYDPYVPAYPFFGCAVSIGSIWAVVGAKLERADGDFSGAVYIYPNTGGWWDTPVKKYPDDPVFNQFFGFSVSMSADSFIAVGAPGDSVGGACKGSVYTYRRVFTEWIQDLEKLTAADGQDNDMFGYSVSMDGDWVIVGAPYHDTGGKIDAGAAYVFHRNQLNQWTQQKLVADDGNQSDYFGISVAIRDSVVVVGAYHDDNACGTHAGSVYMFEKIEDRWEAINLRAPDCDCSDAAEFGTSVALDTGIVVIGSPLSDGETMMNSGAAYVFTPPYADCRYFVHMGDPHIVHDDNVLGDANDDWEKCFDRILAMDPPPEFVTVAGDITDYGAGNNGERNYQALLDYHHLYVTLPNYKYHLLDDPVETTRKIPVFFCPGNHDYRSWKYDSTPQSLDNYKSKLGLNTYYYDTVGPYAVFSLNSGHDEFADAWVLPEGSGLYSTDVAQLGSDLRDNSGFIKVIMAHHTHDNRMDREYDGEFLHNKILYDSLLAGQHVDFAVYGHKHDKKVFYDGHTKCIICEAAEKGKIYEVALHNYRSYEEISLWSVFDVVYQGDLAVYAYDNYGHRTGLDFGPPDTLVQLDIPGSNFHTFEYVNDFNAEYVSTNEIIVHQTDTLSYTFTAEAKSNNNMTIIVNVDGLDGREWTSTYNNVPMYYNEMYVPPYSVATLQAAGTAFDTLLTIVDPGGTTRAMTPSSTNVVDVKVMPGGIHLHQNYPNPFNPMTNIRFDLPRAGKVKLCVYNVKGELVATIIDKYMPQGRHGIAWDGRNNGGARVASGIYFCRLVVGDLAWTKKMVLLR